MSTNRCKTTRTPIAILGVSLVHIVLLPSAEGQTIIPLSQQHDPLASPSAAVSPATEYSIQLAMIPTEENPAAAMATNATLASVVESIESPIAGTSMSPSEPTPMGSFVSPASPLPSSAACCTPTANSPCHHSFGHGRRQPAYFPSHLQRKQASHWGYPEYFCEPELGSSVYAAMHAQKTQGAMQQTVLYRMDFYPEGTAWASQLTPYGKRRLEQLSCRAMVHGGALRIERSPENPELDETRRQFVAEHLMANNLGWSPDSICFVDRVPSISGTEALLHYRNQLAQTQGGPASASGANQGGSAAGAVLSLPNAPVTSPNSQ